MNVKWSVEDRQFIRDNAANMKDKELALALEQRTGRSVTLGSVRKIRQRMGVNKKGGRGICELL